MSCSTCVCVVFKASEAYLVWDNCFHCFIFLNDDGFFVSAKLYVHGVPFVF